MEPDLVLHGSASFSSPYVFSAFVALEEKRLPYELKLLSLADREHERPEYRDASITGRVPALRHGDFWLAESSAIAEYLEEVFPPPTHPRLYPADPRERARVRMVQALVRSDFLPVRTERTTHVLFQGEPAGPLSPEAAAAAARLYRIAGALLPDPSRHLASIFTPADADLSLLLMRLVVTGEQVPPALAAWARRVWTRPSIRAWLAHTRFRG